jgi:hypothetical protein
MLKLRTVIMDDTNCTIQSLALRNFEIPKFWDDYMDCLVDFHYSHTEPKVNLKEVNAVKGDCIERSDAIDEVEETLYPDVIDRTSTNRPSWIRSGLQQLCKDSYF